MTARRYNTLWTFQEEMVRLFDVYDITRSPRNLRLARNAIRSAYRQFPFKNEWAIYHSTYTFHTQAQQTTGTIQYDAGTRQVTLTGATWPDDVIRWQILLGTEGRYNIQTRSSPTVIVLPDGDTPNENLAAGTSYKLFKAFYPLPVNFTRIFRLYDWVRKRSLDSTDIRDLSRHEVSFPVPGVPCRYVIRNANEFYNTLNIQLSPAPSTASAYTLEFLRTPRTLLIEKTNGGLVSVADPAGTTVTCDTAVFTDNMVGSVIRFSGDGTEPTGPEGGWASGASEGSTFLDNPFRHERIITAVNSSTSAEVDVALGESLSGVNYVITDPVDIENGAMLTYWQRAVDAEFAVNTKREDRRERINASSEAQLDAMAADARVLEMVKAGMSRMFSDSEWSTVPADEVVT